jgi:UPF0716 protein FxsA
MRTCYCINNKIKILFWLYVLVEIALFILIGKFIGVLATLGLTLLTAIIGFALLRYQKVMMMKQMQQAMQGGITQSFNMFSGTFLMCASVLLILPGFLTDFLGVLFLIPKIRFWLLGLFMRLQSGGKTCKPGEPCDKGKTIEGEFWEE